MMDSFFSLFSSAKQLHQALMRPWMFQVWYMMCGLAYLNTQSVSATFSTAFFRTPLIMLCIIKMENKELLKSLQSCLHKLCHVYRTVTMCWSMQHLYDNRVKILLHLLTSVPYMRWFTISKSHKLCVHAHFDRLKSSEMCT